jgi:hypothetical protein
MGLLLVHVLLIVLEQLILLEREGCWFECHLEAMGGFRWALDFLEFGFVDLATEIERILNTSFLSGYDQPSNKRTVLLRTLSISDRA